MEERTAIITLRIEPTTKAAFERMAKELDQTTSQMLRHYIRHSVEQHAKANEQQKLALGGTRK
jgi:predicted transcriptional regulator